MSATRPARTATRTSSKNFPPARTRGSIRAMPRWWASRAVNPATARVAGTSKPGAPVSSSNPRKDPASCFQCHLDASAEFNLPHHHPVIEGHMSCVQCHDPHGGRHFSNRAGGLAMARQNESCAQCHRDQTRPFVFEHSAMREGCIVCHSPHGSINQKMLGRERSEPLPALPCANPDDERPDLHR